MKKKSLGNKLYDVVTPQEYHAKADMFIDKSTAIELNDMILPIGNKLTVTPHYRPQPGYLFDQVVLPTEDNMEKYSNQGVIDYDNISTLQQIMENSERLKNMEEDIMRNPENKFILNVSDSDKPMMVAVKKAVNAKGIDINQYEHRFGQFTNDVGMLKRGHDITAKKLVAICDALDMEADIVIRDKADCINKMGTDVTVTITGVGGTEDDK